MVEVERIRRTRASNVNMTRRGRESGDERKERARDGGEDVGTYEEPDPEPDLSWIRGKTVVLYGDSVLRYNMDHFCKASPSPSSPFPKSRRHSSASRNEAD